MYRHFVELELKSLWKECQRRGWILHDLEARHDLMRPWNQIKRVLLRERIVATEDDLMRAVEKSFNLINMIDRSSEHSRYPEDIEGNLHSIDFDLEELVLAMDDVDTLFFGLSAMLDLHDDYISEMASEVL